MRMVLLSVTAVPERDVAVVVSLSRLAAKFQFCAESFISRCVEPLAAATACGVVSFVVEV